MRANFSNSSVHQVHPRPRYAVCMGTVCHVFARKNSFETGKEGQNRKENRYAYTLRCTRTHFRFHRQKFIRIHFINGEWEDERMGIEQQSGVRRKKKHTYEKPNTQNEKNLAKRCGEYDKRKKRFRVYDEAAHRTADAVGKTEAEEKRRRQKTMMKNNKEEK